MRVVRRIAFLSVVALAMAGAAVAAVGDMEGHMTTTKTRPPEPGEKARADAVVAEARKAAEEYVDYHKALADGYQIFMPELKQPVYHFVSEEREAASRRVFDPSKPPALLYEKIAPAKAGDEPGWKLVGVMYTARFNASADQLNVRIPLSIAQWHMHTNLCIPPQPSTINWLAKDPKFGLEGSIKTQTECSAAGGTFLPHLSGWMVHVYTSETDPAKVWKAGMDDDDMHPDAMPGMKMGSDAGSGGRM
jgi:hypothetical protein